MRKAALASVAITTLAVVAGAASIAAASPAAEPATVTSRTLSLDVHFSPFSPLHLNPHPDPKTGFGSGDEITFHDLLFSHGSQAGDEGGSCVIVDGSQLLANCTEVIRLQRGTITDVGTHRELLDTVPAYRELLAADADLEGAAS